MRLRAGPAIVAVLSVLSDGPARAQDSAAAATLFDRGVADMKDGKYGTACPELAESQRLDPRPGTLFTLATCEERAGKLATAVARYDDYLSLFASLPQEQRARQKGREIVAEAKRASLGPQVPKLTLVLPKDAPPGTKLTRDGVVLGAPSLGLALPLDPGEHVVEVDVPGAPTARQTLTIARGEQKLLEVTLPVRASTVSALPPPVASTSPPPETRDDRPSSARRTVALIAGGVGVTGLVVGAVFGARVFGKRSDIHAHCNGSACDETGLAAANDAKSAGTVSNIGVAVGLAGLGAAAVLWLTAPSDSASGALRPTFVVSPREVAFGLSRSLP